MNPSSVVVFQIDVDGIAINPTECNAPVSAGIHRIAALIAADERVKAEPWQIHVLRPRCVSSARRMLARFMFCNEPASVPGREKPFERLVPERADQIMLYIEQRRAG